MQTLVRTSKDCHIAFDNPAHSALDAQQVAANPRPCRLVGPLALQLQCGAVQRSSSFQKVHFWPNPCRSRAAKLA